MGVQRVLLDGQRTWTVTGDDHLPVGPVEEYLEFLRVAQQSSPNTVRSYATSLARWWEHLTMAATAWDEVGLPFLVSFVSSLRTGLPAGLAALPGAAGAAGPSESTVEARVTAVLSFYRYHADAHQVQVADRLYRPGGRAGGYVPGLAHLQRGRRRPGSAVRFRRTAARPVPLLTPGQVEAILDACARQDAGSGQWTGSVRDRLLFAALAETGMRLGELLSTRHCDWHAGRGGTPFIEVIPRQDHPAGVRCKSSRYRRIYISDEL
jgi:site-specific recombinase XerD